MNTTRTLYHLLCADFLERVRRYSFFITLSLTVISAYLLLPARNAGYGTLVFEASTNVKESDQIDANMVFNIEWYRGIYNSAWVGTSIAMLTALFLAMFGFYLVKNTIERDIQTGVGQIIATTPLNKFLYTFGKVVSNFAVLAVMMLAAALVALVMQLVRGEDTHLDLWALFSPFLFITLPVIILVAALAVFFETISWLRGSLGNIVYFFLFSGLLGCSSIVFLGGSSIADVFGIGFPSLNMQHTLSVLHPAYARGGISMITPSHLPPHLFQWNGMQWTSELLLGRLLWGGIAIVVALSTGVFFTRFDPSMERLFNKKNVSSLPSRPEPEPEVLVATPPIVRLSSLAQRTNHVNPLLILAGELRLMLKGVSRWWYLIALGLNLALLFAPLDIARGTLFPLAWLWPMLIWSPLGNREARYQTNQLVFSTARPLQRQLPVQWSAAFLVALLSASGMLIHFILVGDINGLASLLVGAVFIASLALAAGTWTRTSKLFEVLYLLWWYVGPLNHLLVADYMGATKGYTLSISLCYLAGAGVLFVLGWIGRQRQLYM